MQSTDGDYQMRTPVKAAAEDETEELEIESSPIKIESVTQYNKPSDRIYDDNKNRPRIRKAKPTSTDVLTATNINWKGTNMQLACSQGNLPVVLTIWGLALPKGLDLMVPDSEGNTPVHYSSLADNAEPLAFFLHETQKSSGIDYLKAKNKSGQTPLLIAATVGKIPVLKALLEEGSDPREKDIIGSSIFILLAKGGHLWALHFVYTWIVEHLGNDTVIELLNVRDQDNHRPLDWAAEYGDVNVIEYLLRKCCSGAVFDHDGRSPLYWAVFNNHQNAAKLLIQAGCDPTHKDNKGQSPQMLAKLNKYSSSFQRVLYQRPSYTMDTYWHLQQNYPSFGMTLLYAFIIFFLWVIVIATPYYIVIPLYIVGFFIYYKIMKIVEHSIDQQIELSTQTGIQDPLRLSVYENFFYAPEKYLGLWLGSFFMTFLYLLNIIDSAKVINGYMSIGTNSAYERQKDLFWLNFFLVLACTILWMGFVWIFRNPGIINTRQDNFLKALDAAVANYGEPPSHLYCRTTLVEKPIRSKYCASSHVVIARFDHYCVWLCNAIGAGNHRDFMVLLVIHLLFALCMTIMISTSLHGELSTSTTTVLDQLFSRLYFFPLMLCLAYFILSCALLFLFFDQCYNIGANITTNERINGHRYFYMLDETNKLHNRFDRGVFNNLLEFLGIGASRVNYFTLMAAPNAGSPLSAPAIFVDHDDEEDETTGANVRGARGTTGVVIIEDPEEGGQNEVHNPIDSKK